MTDRLLLLDGHSLAYRAFFALPVENFATTTGQPTNAVYGFTAMLINVLRDEKPTRVAVAFDRGEPTFRHEQYVEYKAGRTKAPGRVPQPDQPDLRGARRARHPRTCPPPATRPTTSSPPSPPQASAEGATCSSSPATATRSSSIDDHVTVLYNSRGVSDMKRYDPASLLEKYGLTPDQYPDFAALRGDPSDNLPSIPGVGEKTATKWIVEFGSLENLVNRVDEVKGKAGDALREHLGTCCATASSPRSPRPAAGDGRRHAGRPGPRAAGTAKRSTSSSTPSSSACCATASTRPSPTACPARPPRRGAAPPRPARAGRASRSTRPSSAPSEVAGWLEEHAVVPNGSGACSRRHLGPRHRAGRPPSRSPPPTARARTSTRPR